MMTIPLYYQRDSRWASKKMSPSTVNLGDFGCLVSCLAMAFHNYAINDDPGEFADNLVKVGGFAPSGDLSYSGVMRAYPQVYVVSRDYTTNVQDANLQKITMEVAKEKIQRRIDLGNPTPIWVDAVAGDKRPDHWVLCTEWSGDVPTIYDPGFNEIVSFSKRYGDPMKSIYGSVGLVGPAINFNDDKFSKEAQVQYKIAQARFGISVAQNVREAFDLMI